MAKRDTGINGRLAAYSAAAAAALAVAPAADAAIIYSGPQDIVLNSFNHVLVDLDGDANNDMIFVAGTSTTTGGYFFGIQEFIIYSGSFIYDTQYLAGPPPSFFPANLPTGYPIGPTLAAPYSWANFFGLLTYSISGSVFAVGDFRETTGLMGLRFYSDTCGFPTYGWMRYRDDGFGEGTIVDWAYEDTCTPILAGDDGTITSVPTMGEWGMLALAGLLSAAAINAINKEKEETT